MGRAEDLLARLAKGGNAFIDELILERQSEELFLDFKRSSDQGQGSQLSMNDRDNLAKAISGFGNSEGGLVVWGIDCKRSADHGDVANAKFPILNPHRYKSWLEGAVSGLTLPPHPGVTHLVVECTDRSGFVVTHIPKSHLAPHQCVRKVQYFMRAGSSFLPIPHGVLAGMFGRIPQPNVFHMWATPPAELKGNVAQVKAGLMLANRSAAIARDLYVNVTCSPPNNSSQISAQHPDLAYWDASHALGCTAQVISKESYRLAPESLVQPLILSFKLQPPFLDDFSIRLTLGCSGSPISKFEHTLQPATLTKLFDSFVAGYEKRDSQSRFEFSRLLVGAD